MSHENGHGPAVLEGLRTPSKALRSAIPDVYAGFSSMHKAALEPGTVDAKTKELIALGISVAQQCDGCIASHARGAAMKGATPEAEPGRRPGSLQRPRSMTYGVVLAAPTATTTR